MRAALLSIGIVVMGLGAVAQAVPPSGSAGTGGGRYGLNSPRVSPYVALSGRQNPIVSYYTNVRPQLQQQSTNRQQQIQLQLLEQQMRLQSQNPQQSGSTGIRATGHKSRFMTHTGYYSR